MKVDFFLARWRTWGLVAVGALMAIFIALLWVIFPALGISRIFHIPSDAMSPAIRKGDRILVDMRAYSSAPPHRGDLLVFKTDGIAALEQQPGYSGQTFIKRVAGLPGESLSIRAGELCVNGVAAPELSGIHYETGGMILASEAESYVVPDHCYFVLGDNSHNSLDSRYWGCVPESSMRGRAIIRLWPSPGWLK